MQQPFFHDKQAALLYTQQLPVSACEQKQIAGCMLHALSNVLWGVRECMVHGLAELKELCLLFVRSGATFALLSECA